MNREHARARAGALAHLSTLLLLSSGLSGVAPRPAEAQKAPVKQPPLEVRLIHAIEKQDEPKVRALLQAGADVNRRTEEGHAPLDYAAAFGSVPLCRLLIERGAQVNPAENHYPPLYQAIAANHLGVAQLLWRKAPA
jgi:ankyrin repeat protein